MLQEAEPVLAARAWSRVERRPGRPQGAPASKRGEAGSGSGDGGTAEVEEALFRQMEMQKMLQAQLEVCSSLLPNLCPNEQLPSRDA